jgi:hypothetical protein
MKKYKTIKNCGFLLIALALLLTISPVVLYPFFQIIAILLTALTWDPAIYHVVEVYILNKLDHDNILLIVGLIISGVVLVSYASVKSEKEENMY